MKPRAIAVIEARLPGLRGREQELESELAGVRAAIGALEDLKARVLEVKGTRKSKARATKAAAMTAVDSFQRQVKEAREALVAERAEAAAKFQAMRKAVVADGGPEPGTTNSEQ